MFAALIPALLASGVSAELTPDEVSQAVAQFSCEWMHARARFRKQRGGGG